MEMWSLVFIVFIAIMITDVCGSVKKEWEKFKLENKKSYQSVEEDRRRFRIFRTNLKEINRHNKQYRKGLVTYEKGINKFGDLTAEEFERVYGLFFLKPKVYNDTVSIITNDIPEGDEIGKQEEFFDWREKGAVTPVKDQGTCGSCWIFAAVGILEAYYFKTHKKLVSLSEQNLVDCISEDTCHGGWPRFAMYYIKNEGILTEEDYPYEKKQGKCRNANAKKLKISFNRVISVGDSEEELKRAVTNFGPVIVSICAHSKWMFYKSGVWYEKECCEYLNHSMLLVGYGRENGQDYWLLKNSMGSDWGENGYFRIARNKHHNYCGLTSESEYII